MSNEFERLSQALDVSPDFKAFVAKYGAIYDSLFSKHVNASTVHSFDELSNRLEDAGKAFLDKVTLLRDQAQKGVSALNQPKSQQSEPSMQEGLASSFEKTNEVDEVAEWQARLLDYEAPNSGRAISAQDVADKLEANEFKFNPNDPAAKNVKNNELKYLFHLAMKPPSPKPKPEAPAPKPQYKSVMSMKMKGPLG